MTIRSNSKNESILFEKLLRDFLFTSSFCFYHQDFVHSEENESNDSKEKENPSWITSTKIDNYWSKYHTYWTSKPIYDRRIWQWFGWDDFRNIKPNGKTDCHSEYHMIEDKQDKQDLAWWAPMLLNDKDDADCYIHQT